MGDNSPYGRLGNLIRTGRREKGFAQQAELAAKIGASQQSISRWEAGSVRPTRRVLAEVIKVLGLDAAEVMQAAGYGAREEELPETVTVSFDQPLPVDALSPESFERFMTQLLEKRFPDAQIAPAGGMGHTQDGVDILADFADGHKESFQCKRVKRFGPADVEAAVAADTMGANRKHLVLSRVASPSTAAALARHPGWTLWDKAKLSRLVRELAPSDAVRLVDMFFPGQRFALLGITSAGPWQSAEQFFAPFEDRSATFRHNWPLVGRAPLMKSIVNQLMSGTARITMLEGKGGEGKSRLLKAIADEIDGKLDTFRVLFLAPSETPTADALNQLGEGAKLLIVDDGHERNDLGPLFAHAANRQNQTQLLIATRPYAAERLRREAGLYALADSIHTERVNSLSLAESKELAAEVLREFGGDRRLAEPIAKATRDCPLVTVMAARLAATEKVSLLEAQDTQQFRDTILGKFAAIITGKHAGDSDQAQVAQLLQVIALVQPFSIDDGVFRRLVTEVTSIPDHVVSTLLRNLSEGGVIFRRGALYRLMPDVLGDYIIEQSCLDTNGMLNSLADRVFDAATHPLLGHVLVNLGRLDWRRNGSDPAKTHMLASLWRALRTNDGNHFAVTEAVREAAYYQPAQALAYVEAQLDAGKNSDELSKILKRVAYHFEYVEKVCALLWEMGRDDSRETGPHPSHAMRVLAELCAVEPEKPIGYNKKIVDFGLALLKEPDSFDHHATPFSFLRSIVQGEGTTTSGNGRVIQFGKFHVNYDAVKPLRAAVIDAAIGMLSGSDLRKAVIAAEFLQGALRYPMDARDELRAKYTEEFETTLNRLQTLVKAGRLHKVVVIAVAHSVSWHASYGSHRPQALARQIMDGLPKDLEFRTLAALADGWGEIFVDRGNMNTWQSRLNSWMAELVADLSKDYGDPDHLRAFLEGALGQIVNSTLAKRLSTHVLTQQLLQKRADVAASIVRNAFDQPDACLNQELGMALGMMLLTEPNEARQWAQRFLDSGNGQFHMAVAAAYNHPPLGEGGLDPVDLDIVVRVLGSANPSVVLTGSGIFYPLARKNPRLAIEMLRYVNFRAHPESLDRVFMVFHGDDSPVIQSLTAEDVDFLFSQLIHVRELNGHWLQELMANLSRRFALRTMKFLMDRVELASTDDGFADMRAVNYGPWANIRLRFRQSNQVKILMEIVWSWMTDHDTSDWRFEHNAAALFECMFLPVDELVIEFLMLKLKEGRRQDLWWIANALSHADNDFIFSNSSFVIAFLDQCDRAGRPARRKGVQELFRSAISGVRTSYPGEPAPYDLENQRRAKELLARLPKQSSAYELYNLVLQDAERSIESARQDAEFFDDD
jgi:transcriptional regulator with XRE-family HTH domain